MVSIKSRKSLSVYIIVLLIFAIQVHVCRSGRVQRELVFVIHTLCLNNSVALPAKDRERSTIWFITGWSNWMSCIHDTRLYNAHARVTNLWHSSCKWQASEWKLYPTELRVVTKRPENRKESKKAWWDAPWVEPAKRHHQAHSGTL